MQKTKEILFGGTPDIPSKESFAEVRSKWTPEWKRINEGIEAFRKSPQNKALKLIPESGDEPATIEQVWNAMRMLGGNPYCLLSTDQPEVSIGKITKVIKLTSNQLVKALQEMSINDGGLSTVLLHYDGYTGHCITLRYYVPEKDRFIYFDPWPWDSLLCAKNNMAGINATKEEAEMHWSVTSKELEAVIFAVLPEPAKWERMQNNLPVLKLEELNGSDFFTFFHLEKIAEYDSGKYKEIQYSPSNFKNIVIISLVTNYGNGIIQAILLMSKEWMKENFILVLDITRSFLKKFIPAIERDKYEDLISNLYFPKFSAILPKLVKEGSKGLVENEILLAYAGVIPSADFETLFCNLYVSNEMKSDNPCIEIRLILY